MMNALKEIVAGLWSALCIGTVLLWEAGVKFWGSRSEAQKSVLLAVVIIVVALSVATVARAENQPNSGYGVWFFEDGTGAIVCFMNDPKVDTVGSVYTCMPMKTVGPGTLATRGDTNFCTITGVKHDAPEIECAASYSEAKSLSGGI